MIRQRSHRDRKRGYSLFEVLVAFAIMSMALAVILPAQSKLLSRTSDERNRLLALDWALSHVDLVGLTYPFEAASHRTSHANWTLELNVVPSPVSPNLYAVTATVTSQSGQTLTEIETTRAAP